MYATVSAQLLRVSESADWLEWSVWAQPGLAEPFLAKDGVAHVTHVPGRGIAWDEAAIRKYSI